MKKGTPVRHGLFVLNFNDKPPFAWCRNSATYHDWSEVIFSQLLFKFAVAKLFSYLFLYIFNSEF